MPRRRRNPDELPYDEWIPAHAVMFGDDGSVSLMTEPSLSNPPGDALLYSISDQELGLESIVYEMPDGRYRVAFRDMDADQVFETRIYSTPEAARKGAIEFAHARPYESNRGRANPPTRLSDVKTAFRAIGMTIDKVDDEYIVDFEGAETDAAAYYTDDLADAYYTGLDMARARHRRPNITMQGYTDEHGFHPIRWSPGYRQSAAGEKGKRYSLHPSTEFKKRERARLKRAAKRRR